MSLHQFKEFYIPDRMALGIHNYIKHHILPGDFLQAVICNDLSDAVGKADDENMRNLPAYVSYFYNKAPNICWGSEAKMLKWIDTTNTNKEHKS